MQVLDGIHIVSVSFGPFIPWLNSPLFHLQFGAGFPLEVIVWTSPLNPPLSPNGSRSPGSEFTHKPIPLECSGQVSSLE